MEKVQTVKTIEDIKKYCANNIEAISKIKGKPCEKCVNYRKCMIRSKEGQIESILEMKPEETRLPARAFLFAQSHPCFLQLTPASLYKHFYGISPAHLPCPFQGERIVENLDKITQVYEMLYDEQSKDTFLNVLMYRLTMNSDYIKHVRSSESQYFIDSFCGMQQNTVYVDCGAYTGDTFIDYCRYNKAPRAAYLFEPDKMNLQKLIDSIKPYEKETKIHIIEKGVYNRTGALFFSGGHGEASRILEEPAENSFQIDVVSIDDAIKEDIDFIKMDIEGSEKAAIVGAKQHIEATYPKLAICIYHSVEDLWLIPLMIRNMFPYYSNYELRHYTNTFSETVLYVSH